MQTETPSLWKRFNNFRFRTREILNTSLAQVSTTTPAPTPAPT